MSRLAIATAVAAALVVAGCGGDDGGSEAPEPRPPEQADPAPDLPAGWTLERNAAQGFVVGAPPGWRSGSGCIGGDGQAPSAITLLCSPDRLVTLSVSADRTGEALELTPHEFARRTAQGLAAESYEGLEPGEPEDFDARYDAAAVEGAGLALGSGVRQRVKVVVLRREGVANFTAVIAANDEQPTEPAVRLAERALRTLRSQPVRAPAG